MKKLATTLLTMSVVTLSASAAVVTVNDTKFHEATPGTNTVTISDTDFGGLDLTNASKLAVNITLKSNNDFEAENTALQSITYGGNDMTAAVFGNIASTESMGWSGIFYLDNPSATGDLVFSGPTGDVINNLVVSAMALGNTKAGVGATDLDTGTSGSLQETLTAEAGSLVYMGVASAQYDRDYDATASPDTTITHANNGMGVLHAYETDLAAGTFTTDSVDTDRRTSLSLAEFQAVPEPSAFALIAGCLGFTWVMLRRR